jgi:hypothetical protein
MNHQELTISDVLRDPMIRLMLQADRIPLRDFARLLENAALENMAKQRGSKPATDAAIYVCH